MDKFERSSIIIFEKSNFDKPKIILFRNASWKTFVDLGGKLNKRKKFNKNKSPHFLINNALREVREESLNSIEFINRDIIESLPYVDTPYQKKKSRTYLVCLNEDVFNDKIYYDNYDKIRSYKNVPTKWIETNGIAKFYLDDILKAVREAEPTKDVLCKDIFGDLQKVYRKVADIIRKIQDTKFSKIYEDPINSFNIIDYKGDIAYLNGTKTIEIG